MWNLISYFLTFAGGMASGVMLMCLMQVVTIIRVMYGGRDVNTQLNRFTKTK